MSQPPSLQMAPRQTAPIVPMTLGNMRKVGMRSLAVRRDACHDDVILSPDRWRDDAPVPLFRPRLVSNAMSECAAGGVSYSCRLRSI